MYAVEVRDEDPIEYALDDVVMYATDAENGLEDFAQKHVAENIFSHREITEEEYIKIFDKENDYLKDWTAGKKKQYIYVNGGK